MTSGNITAWGFTSGQMIAVAKSSVTISSSSSEGSVYSNITTVGTLIGETTNSPSFTSVTSSVKGYWNQCPCGSGTCSGATCSDVSESITSVSFIQKDTIKCALEGDYNGTTLSVSSFESTLTADSSFFCNV